MPIYDGCSFVDIVYLAHNRARTRSNIFLIQMYRQHDLSAVGRDYAPQSFYPLGRHENRSFWGYFFGLLLSIKERASG